MEYEYDPEYCWHQGVVANEGTDWDVDGVYKYYHFFCPSCGYEEERTEYI